MPPLALTGVGRWGGAGGGDGTLSNPGLPHGGAGQAEAQPRPYGLSSGPEMTRQEAGKGDRH